jgi:polar amino acid transport system permease protein
MSYPAPAFPVKHPQPQAPGLEVRCVRAADPAAEVLITEMGYQYLARYGPGDDLNSYRPGDFEPPAGALLLLLEGGEPVAGGAFRRYDEDTAEFKRIWTLSSRRRQELARRVARELELAAAACGYQRVRLTTGPRQPEARSLYLATGYTPLFDIRIDPEAIGPLAFEKELRRDPPAAPRRAPTTT